MSPSQISLKTDKASTFKSAFAFKSASKGVAGEPQIGVAVAMAVTLVGAALLGGSGDEQSEVRITRAQAAAEEEADAAGPLEFDVAAVAAQDEALAERLKEEPAVLAPLAEAAAAFEVDPELVLALAWHESRWNRDTVSHAGAVGVMQVMPSTADRIVSDTEAIEPPVDLTDPADNAQIGTAYISGLLDRYDGDRRRALQAYNQGYVTLEKQGPYPSAVAFSERVVATAELIADATSS